MDGAALQHGNTGRKSVFDEGDAVRTLIRYADAPLAFSVGGHFGLVAVALDDELNASERFALILNIAGDGVLKLGAHLVGDSRGGSEYSCEREEQD